MLTYLLALAVALGSFGLYMSGFFYPEVYRKGDLTLAGVGLFYALVLWICADRITGGVLLGQIASVTLIGWFGYQSLTARLGYTPSTGELQAKFSEALNSENAAKAVEQGKKLFSTVKDRAQTLMNKEEPAPTAEPYQPLKREDFGNPTPEAGKPDVMGTIGAVGGAVASLPGVFGGLFKKPEKNTSVYVRKEFRDEPSATPTEAVTDEDDDFGFEADAVEQPPSVSIDGEQPPGDEIVISLVEPGDEIITTPVDGADAVEQPPSESNDGEQPPGDEIVITLLDADGTSASTVPADEIMEEEIAYEEKKDADV